MFSLNPEWCQRWRRVLVAMCGDSAKPQIGSGGGDYVGRMTVTGSGKTELMHAAAIGNLEPVRALIGQGVDVDAVDDDGDTALFYALSNRNDMVVVELLQGRANPDLAGASGPVLHAAVGSGQSEVVSAIVDHGADVNLRSSTGVTASMLAAGSGSDGVMRLLHARGADLNACDGDGDSVLFYAASNGQAATVHLLLALGAVPGSSSSGSQLSPLAVAAMLASGVQARPPGRSGADYTTISLALLRAGVNPDEMYLKGFALARTSHKGITVIRRDQVREWLLEPDLSVMYLNSASARKLAGL